MKQVSTITLAAILLATVLASSSILLAPAVGAKPSAPPYNGPPVSGLGASASSFSSETPGVGQISKTSCTDGTDLGAGNIRVNCDSTVLPHNEMSIAVDPANPSHIVAGSNDYELFFQGSFIVERVIAGYYTSFNGGQTWINGHISPGGFTFSGDPAVAFNTRLGLVHYATIASNGGQGGGLAAVTIQVNTSTDGGVTFGNPVIVGLGIGGTRVTLFNDKPYMTVDNNPSSPFYGRIYVTWTQFLFGNLGNYIQSPIALAFSDDGGKSFSTPAQISGSSSTLCANPFRLANAGKCNEDQFSTPVVGPDGTLYVSFQNDEFEGASNAFRDQYLVVSSTNGGVSFSAPSQAVFPIYDGGNDYPINVDGRQTLTNSQFRVNSAGNLAVDPTSGPGLSTTRLYIVFSDNRNGGLTGSSTTATTNTDVFVVRSDNGGATWTGVLPVHPPNPNDQFYPWAAVSSTGTLVVAYKDRSYDPANIQYGETLATSTTMGASFTNVRVDSGLSNPNDSRFFTNGGATNGKATFIGDYEGLAVGSDGVAHPLWTDMRVSAYSNPPPGRGHNTQDAVTVSI